MAPLFPDQPVLIPLRPARPYDITMTTVAIENPSDLRAFAEQSHAWPFEEARKIVARLQAAPEGRGHLRDRLRPVRPAAYRHLRRGGAHHDGAPRLPRAHRRQDQDAAHRFFRRHGRLAQGSRQYPQQRHGGATPQPAADQGARSVRHACELRRSQQRAPARIPRSVRLRLRIPVVDCLLHVGTFRRCAPESACAFRGGDGDHAAVAARGARAFLFAVPADLAADRRRPAGAGDRARCESGNHHLRGYRYGRAA